MGNERDIERMAEQERRLTFARFDNVTAWDLGTRLKALCEERNVALVIEIRLMRETVFHYAMSGTSPANADWVRRKRNTVELLQRSSYAIGRSMDREGTSLEAKLGLPTRDYAAHGGSFPIRVDVVGCVGVVTVSGLPQREDHAVVVSTLAAMCGVPPEEVALD